MVKDLDKLVKRFADAVIAQTEAIMKGDAKASNRAANRYIRAWEQLRAHGDEGREALMRLLRYVRPDVRAMAAAYLLRYRTQEAKDVLREVARGRGLAAFGAQQALQRWEEGEWNLDPE